LEIVLHHIAEMMPQDHAGIDCRRWGSWKGMVMSMSELGHGRGEDGQVGRCGIM
jgi:hypothetical protein